MANKTLQPMSRRQLTEVVFHALEHSFCVLRLSNKEVARDIVTAIWNRTIPTRIATGVPFDVEARRLAKGELLGYNSAHLGEPRRVLVFDDPKPSANERAADALRAFALYLDARSDPLGRRTNLTAEELCALAQELETGCVPK